MSIMQRFLTKKTLPKSWQFKSEEKLKKLNETITLESDMIFIKNFKSNLVRSRINDTWSYSNGLKLTNEIDLYLSRWSKRRRTDSYLERISHERLWFNSLIQIAEFLSVSCWCSLKSVLIFRVFTWLELVSGQCQIHSQSMVILSVRSWILLHLKKDILIDLWIYC